MWNEIGGASMAVSRVFGSSVDEKFYIAACSFLFIQSYCIDVHLAGGITLISAWLASRALKFVSAI